MMRWIHFPTDNAPAADMGGKARALAALRRAALPIPDWFVIRGDACLASLGDGKLASAKDASAIQKLLSELYPSAEVLAEIKQGLSTLELAAGLVAVRSSAADEDGAEHSFAGQLESYLCVASPQVAERVSDVWRSGFSDRILAYRQQRQLGLVPRPPGVLVQRMIDATSSGRGLQCRSGERPARVGRGFSGVWPGHALVSGEANADTWLVGRSGASPESRIVDKNVMHCPAPGTAAGIQVKPVTGGQFRQPVLVEEQLRAIATLARRCCGALWPAAGHRMGHRAWPSLFAAIPADHLTVGHAGSRRSSEYLGQ